MAALKGGSILRSLKIAQIMSKRHLSNITKVVVIGSGQMGSGIAQVCAQSGYKVVLSDFNDDLLRKSFDKIQNGVKKVAKKKFGANSEEETSFVKNTLGSITLKSNVIENNPESLQDCDLIIEVITENLEAKKELFSKLDKIAPEPVIFASNTSSLSVTKMAEATNRPDRFCGTHFFIPVPVMNLIEVVRTPQTSEDTYETIMKFGKSLGKTPLTCKDTPGFIVNRLQGILFLEALRMLERGDATLEDIDNSIVHGAGYVIGPFKLADYVGLDTLKRIFDGWHLLYPDHPTFKPSPILDKLVQEGKLGNKTGEGFYKYN